MKALDSRWALLSPYFIPKGWTTPGTGNCGGIRGNSLQSAFFPAGVAAGHRLVRKEQRKTQMRRDTAGRAESIGFGGSKYKVVEEEE
jgi:hypothetical protein